MSDDASNLRAHGFGSIERLLAAAAGYCTRARLIAVGLCLVPVTIMLEIAVISSDPANAGRFPLGHDFVAFWSAAKLFAEGGAGRLYDLAAYSALQAQIAVRPGILLWHYPPHFLFLILPLSVVPFAVAYAAFCAVNLGALAAIRRRVLPFPGAAGLAALFGAPVIAATLVQGQNGALFAACLIGGVMARETGRPWLSAALFALVLAKPQYGVLIPVVLVAQRDWAALMRTALCCVMLTGIVTLALGVEIWPRFLENTRLLGYTLTDPELLAQMPTVWAALSLAHAQPMIVSAVHGAVALVAAGLVGRVWVRSGMDPDLALAALLFGTLLISPYGFRYDMVLTLAGTLLLMRRLGPAASPPAEKLLLAAMWLMPALFPVVALRTGVQLGPLVSIAGLAMCVFHARRAVSGSRGAPLTPRPQTATAASSS